MDQDKLARYKNQLNNIGKTAEERDPDLAPVQESSFPTLGQPEPAPGAPIMPASPDQPVMPAPQEPAPAADFAAPPTASQPPAQPDSPFAPSAEPSQAPISDFSQPAPADNPAQANPVPVQSEQPVFSPMPDQTAAPIAPDAVQEVPVAPEPAPAFAPASDFSHATPENPAAVEPANVSPVSDFGQPSQPEPVAQPVTDFNQPVQEASPLPEEPANVSPVSDFGQPSQPGPAAADAEQNPEKDIFAQAPTQTETDNGQSFAPAPPVETNTPFATPPVQKPTDENSFAEPNPVTSPVAPAPPFATPEQTAPSVSPAPEPVSQQPAGQAFDGAPLNQSPAVPPPATPHDAMSGNYQQETIPDSEIPHGDQPEPSTLPDPSPSTPVATPPAPVASPPSEAAAKTSSANLVAEDILSKIATEDTAKKAQQATAATIQEMKSGIDTETKPSKKKKVRFETLPLESLHRGNPLVVTCYSPSGGVGKSSTAMNLGIYIATVAENMARKNGTEPKRVLALDGDIVMGSLGLRLTAKTEPNLYDLIEYIDSRVKQNYKGADSWPSTFLEGDVHPGEHSMSYFTHYHPALPNFNVLAAPKDPAKFWNFSELDYKEVIEMLGNFYDVIIIDAGTELVLDSQRSWLQHAHEVFLITSPDIDRIYNTRKAFGLIGSQQPHPRDNREQAPPMPPLATKDRMSLLVTRADANSGITDLQGLIKKMFPQLNEDQKFWMADVSQQMLPANNNSRFLVREDPEYAKVIGQMAQHAFQRYVANSVQSALPSA